MKVPDPAHGAGRCLKRRTFLTVVAGGGLLALCRYAEGQQLLYYEGTVQWIAGSTMIVMTDDGLSVRVDLKRVDQSEYLVLVVRDRVIVTGQLSPDGNYLIGRSIQRTRLEFQAR